MKEILSLVENSGMIIILPFAFRLLMCIAVFLDAKARNIASRTAYTIGTFFIPVIFGIIYATQRKSAKKEFKVCNTCGKRVGAYTNTCPGCGGLFLKEYKHPKEKMLKTISIVLCVASLLCYTVSAFVEAPDEIDYIKGLIEGKVDYEDELENEYDYDDDIELGSSELCYDKDSRAYSNEDAVLYFSKDGEKYKHIYDEEEYFINTETGNRIEPKYAYVDADGNFYIIKEGLNHIEDDPYSYTISGTQTEKPVEIEVSFSDDEGNIYYRASEASWNYSGKTLICGNTLN